MFGCVVFKAHATFSLQFTLGFRRNEKFRTMLGRIRTNKAERYCGAKNYVFTKIYFFGSNRFILDLTRTWIFFSVFSDDR